MILCAPWVGAGRRGRAYVAGARLPQPPAFRQLPWGPSGAMPEALSVDGPIFKIGSYIHQKGGVDG